MVMIGHSWPGVKGLFLNIVQPVPIVRPAPAIPIAYDYFSPAIVIMFLWEILLVLKVVIHYTKRVLTIWAIAIVIWL